MSRFIDVQFEQGRILPIFDYQDEKLVSLEEAVTPVKSQVVNLDIFVTTAKNRQYPTKDGLTLDEAAAVYLYTMEGGSECFYRMLNQALLSGNRNNILPWFPYLKLFDTALYKLPTVKECLWRGICGDFRNKYVEGTELVWIAVSSCSLSVHVVERFLHAEQKSTLFMIEAVSGKDIQGYTEYPEEKEVILRPGTRLNVKSQAQSDFGGLHVIHLVEVNANGHVKTPIHHGM